MDQTPRRPIKRLLVANRGEIATRIISSARELNIETYAIYVSGDVSHATRADHSIELSSAAAFMSIDSLISIVQKHQIDAIHPGYGFLSESEDFAHRMWDEVGVIVVGPGHRILAHTGDKLKARELAQRCNVPVSPALLQPTNNAEDVRRFACEVGYPIMIKAVDGGGGRGIRLIRSEEQLTSLMKRAVEESPSKQVFAEKAAVDGFRHIEVQIIGDGTGNVTHLWERECSIQRRYQKIVELAPSVVSNRKLVAKVIDQALRIAREVHYFSLGTFEFLVNPVTEEHYFLEVNPRLQVEHTITESISMTDIVKSQLLLAQGANLADCGLPNTERNPEVPPPAHSIQLRITAENVQNDWSLSIGKISSFQFPTGNGIRVDTHLTSAYSTVVSADFDSLIAKLIITASFWPDVVRKAQRALSDTQISGVKTNLDMLRAIVAHPDFTTGNCDTQWLESKQSELLPQSLKFSSSQPTNHLSNSSSSSPASTALSSQTSTLFRKSDAWSIALSSPTNTSKQNENHHLELTRILKNDFPTSLTAELIYTTPASSTPYVLTLTSTTATAASTTSAHPRGNPSDPTHICVPFPGKLVEVLVDEGDVIKEGDTVCVVQQMKMELEVRALRGGRVGWVTEAEDGEEVGEGMLVCVLEGEGREKARL
ncbi:carbamoyl-phosphate synthase L chain, ATP binding domain-containing protein [Phaeosphaeria sp. MPI-PUGE-AT-0046c]|nr:carbamoyl-phosphate synthase L chain, ATP binding domain-containing protein [Phaeosphaeria sp. MPI-PUGE-AT-0046c]